LNRPVLWSQRALDELDRDIAYIAERNPTAARHVLGELRHAAEGLGVAATGRRGRVAETYEKVVTGRPYILAYALLPLSEGGEVVVVLRVIHAARNWPEGEWSA
jgi:plasmid stabilization system protein ParE